MKRFYILIILFLPICFLHQLHAQSWLKGHWVGTGYQYTDSSTWDINLDYISRKSVKISYPSIPCRGNFERVKSNGHKVVYIESIIVGKEKCYDKSTVIITKIDKDFISVAYFIPSQFEGAVATAILERKKINVKTVKKL